MAQGTRVEFQNLSVDEQDLHPHSTCGVECSYPQNVSSYLLATWTETLYTRHGAITLDSPPAYLSLTLDTTSLHTATSPPSPVMASRVGF